LLSLSAIAKQEKNKLGTDSVFLVLMEVTIPGEATPARVAMNTENVTWASQTWTAFPFELDDIVEESKGEVPSLTVKVGNESRVMEAYIQAYDTYCKANGFSPITVVIYVVNSKNLGSATPESAHNFSLQSIKSDTKWVSFGLGASNPFRKRTPLARILRNQCRWIFKSTECGYSGATTTCNKTLTACRAMDGGSNSIRYGGFPGVGNTAIKVGSV
jgi:lambda family phage minor tail protein L